MISAGQKGDTFTVDGQTSRFLRGLIGVLRMFGVLGKIEEKGSWHKTPFQGSKNRAKRNASRDRWPKTAVIGPDQKERLTSKPRGRGASGASAKGLVRKGGLRTQMSQEKRVGKTIPFTIWSRHTPSRGEGEAVIRSKKPGGGGYRQTRPR